MPENGGFKLLISDGLYIKKCRCCGAEFRTKSKRAYVCSACKKNNKHQLDTFRNQVYKRPKKVVPSAPDELFKRVREVEKYNKEHGTDYSYGTYELAKFFNKI